MKSIDGIVESGLCCGCGACAYVCPEFISMVDVEDQGRRPRVKPNSAVLQDAIEVCPGAGLAHDFSSGVGQYIPELLSAWGPILEVWEGYAVDTEVRHAGSSGGAATALALYCLEAGNMEHVLHTAAREDVPYLNETVVSRCRSDLMKATGSRYAPASPCDGLKTIENADGRCAFIGKPCDVAAVQKARRLRPSLERNLGVTIGFFCAGTPSTRGTLELLKRMGLQSPKKLESLRYRGNGWPGSATAVFQGASGAREVLEMSYEESWGEVLSKHQQWRCKLCADHTGEFADISVGDPWYRSIENGEAGSSLILARTELGKQIILSAVESGYLKIEPVDPQVLPASQPNLLRTRGALWGRLLGCRLVGAPIPTYRSMPLFRHWIRELSWLERVRSVLGTMRRVLRMSRRFRKRDDNRSEETSPRG